MNRTVGADITPVYHSQEDTPDDEGFRLGCRVYHVAVNGEGEALKYPAGVLQAPQSFYMFEITWTNEVEGEETAPAPITFNNMGQMTHGVYALRPAKESPKSLLQVIAMAEQQVNLIRSNRFAENPEPTIEAIQEQESEGDNAGTTTLTGEDSSTPG